MTAVYVGRRAAYKLMVSLQHAEEYVEQTANLLRRDCDDFLLVDLEHAAAEVRRAQKHVACAYGLLAVKGVE